MKHVNIIIHVILTHTVHTHTHTLTHILTHTLTYPHTHAYTDFSRPDAKVQDGPKSSGMSVTRETEGERETEGRERRREREGERGIQTPLLCPEVNTEKDKQT